VPGVDNQAKENAFRVLFGGRRVVDSRLIRVVLENLECVLGEEGLRDLVFTRPHVLASPYLRRNLGLLRDKGMEFLYLKDPGVFVHEKLEETLCVFDAMALDSLYRESPSILSEGLKARDRLIKDAVASLGDRHFLSSIEGYAERLAEKGLSGEEVRRLISLSTYTTDSGTPTAAALKAREILLKAYLTRRGDVLNFYSGYMSLLKEAKFRRHYTEVKSALSYLRDYEPGALIVMRLAASLEKEYGHPIDAIDLTDAEFSDLREKASDYGDNLITELNITGSSLNAALDLLLGSNTLGIWKLEASDRRLRLIADLYHKKPVRVSDYNAGTIPQPPRIQRHIKTRCSRQNYIRNTKAIEKRFPEALMDRRGGIVVERDAALAGIDRESLEALLAEEERIDAVRFSVLWEVLRGREKKDIISDISLGTDISPVTYKKYIEDFRQRGLLSPDGRPFPTRKMFSYMRRSGKSGTHPAPKPISWTPLADFSPLEKGLLRISLTLS